MTDISHLEKVQANIDKKKKEVIFFVSPSATASIVEHFGIKPDQNPGWYVCSAIKKMGGNKVFDLGVTSDLNIREEARLLIERVRKGSKHPLFSSCCPSWVKFVEEFQPELIPFLSTSKSPQQIFGTLLKTWYAKKENILPDNIFSVAVMPCTGKKFEASRDELTVKGISEVDAVLTIREFIRMIRANGIDLRKVHPVPFDEPFSGSSRNALKLGYSGGKAEAVAFELFENLKSSGKETFKFNIPKTISGRKESKLTVGKKTFGFAWVSGISNAKAYIDELIAEGRNDIHYIEVMACLEGCVGGGGQPINRIPDIPRNRKKICQDMEKFTLIQKPSENPCLDNIFRTMEEKPDEENLPVLFHTRFIKREITR
ncbi:MAG: [Fe-Fe] hydrogenase large subunit C-terminal domain-containing protein [Bacteroides sp.]|nr:[Fe-Fe] hydrogenase large subunit C-terminal domain-containing protein [Bacteroides sp.]